MTATTPTSPATPLRLLIYDRTCRGRPLLPGLSHAWGTGRFLYGALGRLDAGHGAESWADALDWLENVQAGRAIAEIQFWGHGRWGEARIAGDVLDAAALFPEHPLAGRLDRVRARLRPGKDGLWWFRTCETFGTEKGQAFAVAWTRFFGCAAAGHTFRIGVWQSGLHRLLPGDTPRWPADEGLTPAGLPASSHPRRARTLHFLQGRIPGDY